jgi:hypothetical protein
MMIGAFVHSLEKFAVYSPVVILVSYHFYQFYSTSPEEFTTRLREHQEQKSAIKQGYGEERKFSSLSCPKEDTAKYLSPTFTKQKVRILFLMKFNRHVK